MTLSSNRFLSDEKLNSEDVLVVANFQFSVRLDSKNRIFRTKFHPLGSKRLVPYIEELLSSIIDLDIEKVVKKLDITSSKFAQQFEMSEAHFLVREVLEQLCHPGKYLSINKEKIICRCTKLDLEKFEQEFDKAKGSLLGLKKNTNASLFCGGCSEQVEKYSQLMQTSKNFYEGKTTEEIYDIVTKSFSGFKEYTALDVSDLSIKLEKVDLPKLKISLMNYKGDRGKLINSFENYLFSQLRFIIKIDYEFEQVL